MTFQRVVIALLVLIVAGIAAVGYFEWKMAVQVRTMKAFVEGYVFNEAVMACERAQSSTPFKWNGGKSTAIVGLHSVKSDKYGHEHGVGSAWPRRARGTTGFSMRRPCGIISRAFRTLWLSSAASLR